jgi:hypothetical protein
MIEDLCYAGCLFYKDEKGNIKMAGDCRAPGPRCYWEQALRTEFCIKCGMSWPPREGEIGCVEWEDCRQRALSSVQDQRKGQNREPSDAVPGRGRVL